MMDIGAIRRIELDEAHWTLPDLVESVRLSEDPCIITRDGEPVAVLAGHAHFFMLMGAYFFSVRPGDGALGASPN